MRVVVARQLEKDREENKKNVRCEVFLQCAPEQGTQLINDPNEALILSESQREAVLFPTDKHHHVHCGSDTAARENVKKSYKNK